MKKRFVSFARHLVSEDSGYRRMDHQVGILTGAADTLRQLADDWDETASHGKPHANRARHRPHLEVWGLPCASFSLVHRQRRKESLTRERQGARQAGLDIAA